MRWMAIAIACAGGCAPAVEETSLGLGGPPLTDVPRWEASGPSADECFGASVATGDLDGDGRRDLIVAAPPCVWQPAAPGRVAVFPGAPGGFGAPVSTPLDWQNGARGGYQMQVSIGDVDGDGRADLLVRSGAGVQLFAGITDAAAPLPPPAWRAPGTGAFGAAVLADVDGDGRHEIASVKAGAVTVWRAGAAARALPGTGLVRVRDLDADGRDDLVVVLGAESQLYRGCPLGAPDCDGGLTAAPVWASPRRVLGAVPDQSGDGRAELLLADGLFEATGRVTLHLSAGDDFAPAATQLGDPNYVAFGNRVERAGDLDGDGADDFVVAAAGRLYGFFPAQDPLPAPRLAPRFAWPREDEVQRQLLGAGAVFTTAALAIDAPGDLDGDGRAELVVGNANEIDDPRPGRVFVFGGGRLRPLTPARPRPHLSGAPVCGAPADARPDLTVDADALARSLYIERRTFAPGSCEQLEGCLTGPGERRLLRFTTSIANLGGGPVIIPGPETAPHLYHFDACHGHDHLSDFARYELRDRDGGVIAVGRKQGFFLVDLAPYCADGAPSSDYYPDQGISAGWSDVYVASIACQWLDITDVPDGRYTLRVDVDTLGLVDQHDVLPDTAAVGVRIHGDVVRVTD